MMENKQRESFMRNAIILAAGKSLRMKSKHSKVIHKLFDKEIIKYITEAVSKCDINNTVVVVGQNFDEIKKVLGDTVVYAIQNEQLGTAHAVASADSLKGLGGDTLIVMGDTPLIKQETIKELFEKNLNYDLTVLTTYLQDPSYYGRVIRNKQNKIEKITEFKNCNSQEKLIKEINTGVYCVKNSVLFKFLPYILNSPLYNEYKLTDIIELLVKNNCKVQALVSPNSDEFLGVNTRIDLHEVYKIMQKQINDDHMLNGVTLNNPESIYIGKDVIIGTDVTIYPNNYISGNTTIGEGAVILSNCFILNAQIEAGCVIDQSKITDSTIKEKTTIGPFAHIRKNSVIGQENRIGNFVEVKNSVLDKNVKSAHLSYLGDSEIGENVNIGCGAVTVNYDGFEKHKTKILENSFIGCNANLLAPITIGKNTVVAAGSTITDDVPDGDMAIARSYQTIKEGYGQRFFDKKKSH